MSGVWCPVPADEAPGGKKNEEGRSSEVALRAEGAVARAVLRVADFAPTSRRFASYSKGGSSIKTKPPLRKKVIDAWGGGGG